MKKKHLLSVLLPVLLTTVFSLTGCSSNSSGGEEDPIPLQWIEYYTIENVTGTAYALRIMNTQDLRAVTGDYNPKQYDDYRLTVRTNTGMNVSVGYIEDVLSKQNIIRLKPVVGVQETEIFEITITNKGIRKVDGTVTWNDGTSKIFDGIYIDGYSPPPVTGSGDDDNDGNDGNGGNGGGNGNDNNGGQITPPDITPDPDEPSVTVSPSAVTVSLGSTQLFSAIVLGLESKVVEWSIDEVDIAAGTGIGSSTGELTIDDAEIATSLTVRATSTEDRTVSGAAMVTINDKVNAVFPAVTLTAANSGNVLKEGTIKLTLSVANYAAISDQQSSVNAGIDNTFEYEIFSSTTASVAGGTSMNAAKGVTGTSETYDLAAPETDAAKTIYLYAEVTNSIYDDGDGGVKTAKATVGPVKVSIWQITQVTITSSAAAAVPGGDAVDFTAEVKGNTGTGAATLLPEGLAPLVIWTGADGGSLTVPKESTDTSIAVSATVDDIESNRIDITILCGCGGDLCTCGENGDCGSSDDCTMCTVEGCECGTTITECECTDSCNC